MAGVLEIAGGNYSKHLVYTQETDLQENKLYNIRKGGSVITYNTEVSQSASTSAFNWSIKPPNRETITSRLMILRAHFRATVVGPTPGAGDLVQLNQGLFSLRSFPLNSCITTAQIQPGQSSFSTQPYEYISALSHSRLFQDDLNAFLSEFPSLPDNCQDYHELVGASTNPLNGWTSSDYFMHGRGAYPMKMVSQVSGGGTTTVVIDIDISEPLICSPMLISSKWDDIGFYGIDQINVNLTLGNLVRLFSSNLVDGNSITSISVALNGDPELLVKYITPDPVMQIPQTIQYGYEQVDALVTQGISVNANSTNILKNTNLQLNQIPSKIFIYLRRKDSDLQTSGTSFQYADGFANIYNCSINFNNVNGLLGSATEEQLWLLSVKNGMNLSWDDWHGSGPNTQGSAGFATQFNPIGVGSILCIDPTEDFGLPSNQAPGLYGGSYNFQATVSYKNLSQNAINLDLFVVTVQDGVFTIFNDGRTFTQLGVLTASDILNAGYESHIPHEVMSLWGGSFLSKLKTFGKDIVGALKSTKALSRIAKAFPQAQAQATGEFLEKVGLGMVPYRPRPPRRRGGGAVSMDDLRKRINGSSYYDQSSEYYDEY
jgi:hypothetical protein